MMEKIYITNGQISKFESFMEPIYEKYRLYSYAGAIHIAIESVLNIVNQDIILSFSHYKDGICFSIEVNSDLFSQISFSDTKNQNFDALFLIKHLANSIDISQDGKIMKLFFSIDGIEEELSVSRKEKIKAYSFRKVKILQ